MKANTIGVEIEFTNATMAEVSSNNYTNWRIETDGSVRHNGGRFSLFDEERFFSTETEYGGEIISPVLTFDSGIWGEIMPITDIMYSLGETPKANNSIHIHYGIQGMPIPLLSELYCFLHDNEAMFFDVASPEGSPRGVYNDFIYYRPLKSPQWAYSREADSGVYRPSIGKLESIKTFEELRSAAGRLDLYSRKWIPPRYCGINFVSIITNGTLEFRMFNFTSNFLQLKAWVMLVGGFMGLVRKGIFSVDINEILAQAAVECNSSDKELWYVQGKLSPKDIYSSIDLTPILTHTGQNIDWKYNNAFLSLVPDECSRSEPRRVRNPHPMNSLSQENFFHPLPLSGAY